MRHLKAGKRLGVTTSHRKALMRNLVTALLEHGEIRTTITRAKEMRKYFDKMIGLGKKNNLHARRQALSFVKSKDVVKKLFEEYGPLYENRNGGYTRIYRLARRLGDNSQMALIQMVGLDDSVEPVKETASETIEEVKEELQTTEEQETQVEAQDTPESVESSTEEEVADSAGVEGQEDVEEGKEESTEPESSADESQDEELEKEKEDSPESEASNKSDDKDT